MPGITFKKLGVRKLALIFCALSALDVLFTATLLEMGNGQVVEANPFAAHFLGEYGVVGLVCFKLIVVVCVLGLCFIIHRHRPSSCALVLTIGCIVLTVVDAYSLGRILRAILD